MKKPDQKILILSSVSKDSNDLQKIFEKNDYVTEVIADEDQALKELIENPENYRTIILDKDTSKEKPYRFLTKFLSAFDQARYYESSKSSTEEQAAWFLTEGHFRFRLLPDAHVVSNFLAYACPNPRIAVVGISEILINAIEHGNLGISYEEKSKLQQDNKWIPEIERRLNLPENIHKHVDVYFKRSETEIMIKVSDQGDGFDWRKYQELDQKNKLGTHGRGIVMAKNLVFNKIEFSEKGNEVTCFIPLK